MVEGEVLTYNDWVFQWRPAEVKPARLLLLIHGLSGDEHSMWIFTRKAPKDIAVLAPRAIHPAQGSGYTWRTPDPARLGLLPDAAELMPAARALLRLVDEWGALQGLDVGRFMVAGFSQGTAVTYLLSLLVPDRVERFAALSGFIPQGAGQLVDYNRFAGKPVFISHNRQDDMVPIEKAREASRLLSEAGAKVIYCENDGGHKVSKDCLHALDQFLFT